MDLKRKSLVLFFILAAGFIVRVIGINYGLPFAYHDDEPIIVNYALAYGAGDFNPHVFKIAPFLSYVLFFLYGILFAVGYVIGHFKGVSDFAYQYLNDPTLFYMTGRAVFGLLCGTGSVLLVYFAGKKYFSKEAGILGALFLAFNYLHVRDSHYIYFDVPVTFFVLLFFIKLNGLLKAPVKRSDYVLSGVFFALAFSVKYTAVFLAVPFFLALAYSLYVSRDKKLSLKATDILLCGLSSLVVIFLLNPFAFLSFGEFWQSVRKMPFVELPPYFHLKTSLFNGCGMVMTALGALGVLLALITDRDKKALLAVYALLYYWVISGSSQAAERLVMPLVPIVLLFAAAAIIKAKSLIRKRTLSNLAFSVVIIVVMFPSMMRIYYSDALFLKEDTRTQAYKWVRENIPADSRIALDATASWFPKLEKSREQIKELSNYFEVPQFDKPMGADQKKLKFMLSNPYYPEKTYYLYYVKETAGTAFLSVQPDINADYSEITSKRIEYILLSHTLVDEKYRNFVGEIEKKCKLIKTFSPYKDNVSRIRPGEVSLPPAAAFMFSELRDRKSYGPVIKIYKR